MRDKSELVVQAHIEALKNAYVGINDARCITHIREHACRARSN